MECRNCRCVVGNRYRLDGDVVCNCCGQQYRIQDVSCSYHGMSNNYHVFKLNKSKPCTSCGLEINSVSYLCFDDVTVTEENDEPINITAWLTQTKFPLTVR